MKTGVILLAGGIGSRMGATIPKQFLELKGKPIARYSLEVFQSMAEITEIVVVVEDSFRSLFQGTRFASPGPLRQNSAWNGLQQLSPEMEMVLVHDAARPFIDSKMVLELISEAKKTGAAALGMPLKFTVKEVNAKRQVLKTPDRSSLWEIQTPQAVRRDLLEKGFAIALENNITVTDDTSLVELFHHPVTLVKGSYSNIKITTPDDLAFAELILGGKRAL